MCKPEPSRVGSTRRAFWAVTVGLVLGSVASCLAIGLRLYPKQGGHGDSCANKAPDDIFEDYVEHVVPRLRGYQPDWRGFGAEATFSPPTSNCAKAYRAWFVDEVSAAGHALNASSPAQQLVASTPRRRSRAKRAALATGHVDAARATRPALATNSVDAAATV